MQKTEQENKVKDVSLVKYAKGRVTTILRSIINENYKNIESIDKIGAPSNKQKNNEKKATLKNFRIARQSSPASAVRSKDTSVSFKWDIDNNSESGEINFNRYKKISDHGLKLSSIEKNLHRSVGFSACIKNNCFRNCAHQSLFFCSEATSFFRKNEFLENQSIFRIYKTFLETVLDYENTYADISSMCLYFYSYSTHLKAFEPNKPDDPFEYLHGLIKTLADEEKKGKPNDKYELNPSDQHDYTVAFFSHFYFSSLTEIETTVRSNGIIRNNYIFIDEIPSLEEACNTYHILEKYFNEKQIQSKTLMKKYIIINLNRFAFINGAPQKTGQLIYIDEEVRIGKLLFVLRSCGVYIESEKHFVNIIFKNNEYFSINDYVSRRFLRNQSKMFLDLNTKYVVYEMFFDPINKNE